MIVTRFEKRGLESDLSVYREERQTKQLHHIVIGEACLPACRRQLPARIV